MAKSSRVTLRLYWGLFVALLLLPGMAAPAAAQVLGGAQHVTWDVSAEPADVRPGGIVRVVFDVAIDDGWKMYALDSPRPSRGVEVHLDDMPPGLIFEGELQQSPPKEGHDPNFGVTVRYFEGKARLAADIAVAEDAAAGPRRITGQTVFMICNANLCLPPTRTPFDVGVQVLPAAATAAPPAAAGGSREAVEEPTPGASSPAAAPAERVPDLSLGAPPLQLSRPQPDAVAEGEATVGQVPRDLDEARAGGLWGFLLLAVGAGLAALLTPCVFPMIPLTVSYFTKHADDRRTAVRMALVYGMSIVGTFTALGVVTALLVGAAGAQTIAANPWINLFIGLIFVVFALSLLGLFELRLPGGLLNYFNRQSHEQGGYLGVLFMGLTLTLVSFSCTAPFVGGLLAATASDEWAYPVAGMLAFSATFSLPFVLFALFPKGLSSLPRSGAWMNTVKVTLGFVELAAAFKFLSNADLVWGWGLLSRTLAVSLIVVIFFLAGLYLIGKLRLKDDPEERPVGVVQLLVAIAFFGLSLYMLPGLLGAPLGNLDAYLPPRQATDVSLLAALPQGGGGAADEFTWYEDVDSAVAAARTQAKPVFIDFTGYTCTNCRQMEANVFPRPEVAQRLENDFVLLRLYTDDAEVGPDLQRYQLQMTGTVALPTYAIVDPATGTLIQRHTGIASTDEFLRFLERGRSAFGAG